MKVALLLPVLAGRDAVGNDTLAMANLLRARGIDTRIFCDVAVGTHEATFAPDQLLDFAGAADDIVIYHFSVGWPQGLDILRRARGFRMIRYHNITPPTFFAGISPIHEATCARGLDEIAAIAQLGCERYCGASEYNLRELIAAGAPAQNGCAFAPFHRIDHLIDAEADLGLLDELNDGALNVLMVGRIAPNKNHVALIDAFAAYVDGYGDPARLIIVGKTDPGLAAYTEAIRNRIDERQLGARVWWLESVDEAALKAAYVTSHAFMTLSEHEGFCVPLVEAMALGVPVVAHASSAIGETCGDGGITWGNTDAWLYAASLARFGDDPEFRADLCDKARRRYRHEFAWPVLRERFFTALAPAL